MDAIQANALITKGARIDPRMGRADAQEQAQLAKAWAELLADVALADADAAMTTLLRGLQAGAPAILPGDILAELGTGAESGPEYVDHTPAYLERKKAEALAAAGVSESEYLAAVERGDRGWLESRFPKAVEA
jgi:hypothetical protein